MSNSVISNPITIQYNYDLARCTPDDYIAILNTLFNSEKWHELFVRRAKFFRVIANRSDAKAIREVDAIDTKAARLLLSTMVQFANARVKQQSGRVVTLREYFDDFVRTKEQEELYENFSNRLDSAIVLADILEVMLSDALDSLRQLDPSCVLGEFDGIKDAMKQLKDFTSIHHNKENNELTTIFCDFAEEVEDWIRPKIAIFLKKYKDHREALVARGELKPTKKPMSDREWMIMRMEDYFYVSGPTKGKAHESKQKARQYVNAITDEEMPQAKEYIAKLVTESERIRMAHDAILVLNRNLPPNDTSIKLLKNLD